MINPGLWCVLVTRLSHLVAAMPDAIHALYEPYIMYTDYKYSDHYCTSLFELQQWHGGRPQITSVAAWVRFQGLIEFICEDTRGKEFCCRQSPAQVWRLVGYWMVCQYPDTALVLPRRVWTTDGIVRISKGICVSPLRRWLTHVQYKVMDCAETVFDTILWLADEVGDFLMFAWTTYTDYINGPLRTNNADTEAKLLKAEFISLTPLVKNKKLRSRLVIMDQSSAIFDERHIHRVNHRACARANIPFTLHIAAIPTSEH